MDVNVHGEPIQEGRRIAKGNVTRDVVSIGFTQADLGEGNATGVLVRDSVCLSGDGGNQACADVTMVATIRLDDIPFSAMPHDGIIGLGLQGLAAGPFLNFLGRLSDGSKPVVSQFGISFGPTNGEIYFGGHNAARLAAPLQWFPVVTPADGYWQVAVGSVQVGNVTVDACHKGCRGVIDTGASRIGVLPTRLRKLRTALASSPGIDASCHGPDLKFDLGGFVLTLRSEDYTDAACTPQLGVLNLEEPAFTGVYAFGETVLRRYYAAFDWEALRVGFAPASPDALFSEIITV